MKTYTIDKDGPAHEGIVVDITPYPHITLGEGGHKRATWVPLGKRDADRIIVRPQKPCPNRGKTRYGVLVGDELPACEKCGERYVQSGNRPVRHPDSGTVETAHAVLDVGVLALKDRESGKPTGRHLIVAPRPGKDNRALVLWRVPSGYRGSARISPGESVSLIARDSSWHSGRGSLGETDECLAILRPGESLYAEVSGRRVQGTRGILTWTGSDFTVTFGGTEMADAISDDAEGEHI